MTNIKDKCKCSYCTMRASIEVTGDDNDIKREFDRIELANRMKQVDAELSFAYSRFEAIADNLGVTVADIIINAQSKTPSTDIDGV